MSQEQAGGGLPTAAYRWRDHVGVEQTSINSPEEPMHEHNEKFGADELVRRADVKALIQDKIEQVELYPSDQEIAIEQSKILQELLEEVEGEASK